MFRQELGQGADRRRAGSIVNVRVADAGRPHPDQDVLVTDGRDRYFLYLQGLADVDKANCFHDTPP